MELKCTGFLIPIYRKPNQNEGERERETVHMNSCDLSTKIYIVIYKVFCKDM